MATPIRDKVRKAWGPYHHSNRMVLTRWLANANESRGYFIKYSTRIGWATFHGSDGLGSDSGCSTPSPALLGLE